MPLRTYLSAVQRALIHRLGCCVLFTGNRPLDESGVPNELMVSAGWPARGSFWF